MPVASMKRLRVMSFMRLVLRRATAYVLVPGLSTPRLTTPRLTTQDYLDIQQLIARYAVAIDECSNNGYDYAALYTDDGWFSASRDGRPGTKWQGKERLAAAARGNMKTCDDVPWKGVRHMYVNHVITPAAEGAIGRIDLVAIGLDGDPHKVEHQGTTRTSTRRRRRGGSSSRARMCSPQDRLRCRRGGSPPSADRAVGAAFFARRE
jgi:hypothetical protein